MSFAVWQERPPFTFKPGEPEQIYQVGSVWVVTDDPARATQAEVDAALAPRLPDTAAAAVARQRAQSIEDLEHRLSLGAPQGGIIKDILNLLKE